MLSCLRCTRGFPNLVFFNCVALAILFAGPARAQVILGAHTLLGQEDGNSTSPALTLPISTSASASYLLSFSAGYTGNNNLPTDNKGNVWQTLGAPVIYEGYGGAFNVKAFAVANALGGAGHRVSIVKNANQSGELTLPFIEIKNALLQQVAQNYAPFGTNLTSASVTTTGPAVLLAVWWGDGGGLVHTAVPNNGFNIIENFVNLPPGSAVQCVVAAKTVSAAGTFNVSWATTPAQGAPLWLFAFQADMGGFVNGFE